MPTGFVKFSGTLLTCILLSACSQENPSQQHRPVQRSPDPPASPAPAAMTVLCLGDSLTAGYRLDQSQAYPALLQGKIDALGWNFEVINAGLGGDTTAAALRRLDWLLQRRLDVLILAVGGNDALRGLPLKETQKNLESIVSKTRSRYPRVTVVLAGMQIPPNYGAQYVRQFRSLFPKVAEKHQTLLIPFLLEGVAGQPELNFPDGIHPNVRGQEIVAANVWKIIEPVLSRLESQSHRYWNSPAPPLAHHDSCGNTVEVSFRGAAAFHG